MAEKIAEEKPPIYEISPKWIFIYQAANIFIGLFATFASFLLQTFVPLYLYFVSLLFLLQIQFLDYNDFCRYRKIYHPDLLPDFKKFQQLLWNAKHKIESYKSKGNPVPAKYQETYDTLKPIIEGQQDLRFICWFKSLIGVPKSDVQKVDYVNIKIVNKKLDVNPAYAELVETEASLDSDSDSINYFSATDEEDLSDDCYESDTSISDSDIYFINNKKFKFQKFEVNKKDKNAKNMSNKKSQNTQTSIQKQIHNIDINFFEDSEIETAISIIKNEIHKCQTETTVKNHVGTESNNAKKENLDKNVVVKDDLKQIELEFTEMKADFILLKNSFENLIASKIVF